MRSPRVKNNFISFFCSLKSRKNSFRLNYFLIGQPGAGKSTLGRELASKLEYDFVDIDRDVLEVDFKCSVSEKLATLGQEGFVQAEADSTCKFLGSFIFCQNE